MAQMGSHRVGLLQPYAIEFKLKMGPVYSGGPRFPTSIDLATKLIMIWYLELLILFETGLELTRSVLKNLLEATCLEITFRTNGEMPFGIWYIIGYNKLSNQCRT